MLRFAAQFANLHPMRNVGICVRPIDFTPDLFYDSGSSEEAVKTPLCLLTRQGACGGSTDNYYIVFGLDPWPQRTERLADEPFDPVALDAFAHFLAGGGNSSVPIRKVGNT